MNDHDLYQLLTTANESTQLTSVIQTNEKSVAYGLSLTEADAKELLCCRRESLQRYHRIELGHGILDQLVDHFCDSPYLDQANYLATLEALQDIFYEAKNNTNDQVTDEELLNFMEEQFNSVCYGDIDYLTSTCLERFATAVGRGDQTYHQHSGKGYYEKISDEAAYDKTLYYQALKDQF